MWTKLSQQPTMAGTVYCQVHTHKYIKLAINSLLCDILTSWPTCLPCCHTLSLIQLIFLYYLYSDFRYIRTDNCTVRSSLHTLRNSPVFQKKNSASQLHKRQVHSGPYWLQLTLPRRGCFLLLDRSAPARPCSASLFDFLMVIIIAILV